MGKEKNKKVKLVWEKIENQKDGCSLCSTNAEKAFFVQNFRRPLAKVSCATEFTEKKEV